RCRCVVSWNGQPSKARSPTEPDMLHDPRDRKAVGLAQCIIKAAPMSNVTTKPRTKVRPKTERPRLHKVILVNDDYTPREFVVTVLKAEFRMSQEQAYRVMMTAK